MTAADPSLSANSPSNSTPKALFVIAALAGALVLLFTATAVALFASIGCGGDGGVPYAAIASTRGRFCDSGIYNSFVAFSSMAPPALVLVGGVMAFRQRAWKPLLMFTAAGILLIPATSILFFTLPSECSESQIEAGELCDTY